MQPIARYLESPTLLPPLAPRRSVFLAGGITDCPDWQEGAAQVLLADDAAKMTVFNPRRQDFPIDDPEAAKAQIKWEHDALRLSEGILFWFPCETLCPIVLYELGYWSARKTSIFVGIHPDYKRKSDVQIQTRLARPEVQIVYGLSSLLAQVRYYFRGVEFMQIRIDG